MMEQESAPRRRRAVVLGAVLGSAAVAAVAATIRPGATPATLRSGGADAALVAASASGLDTHNDTKKFDFCAEQNTGATWQASSGSFLWGQSFENELCLLQPADASEINNLYDIGGSAWKDVSVGVDFTLNSLKESMAVWGRLQSEPTGDWADAEGYACVINLAGNDDADDATATSATGKLEVRGASYATLQSMDLSDMSKDVWYTLVMKVKSNVVKCELEPASNHNLGLRSYTVTAEDTDYTYLAGSTGLGFYKSDSYYVKQVMIDILTHY
jgi:hypothetical protein